MTQDQAPTVLPTGTAEGWWPENPTYDPILLILVICLAIISVILLVRRRRESTKAPAIDQKFKCAPA